LNISALQQNEAAMLLSISPRTLRDWKDAPRNPDGTYPGPALVSYHVQKLTGDDLDLNKERARLAKEQADRTALANAISRGDVIPSSLAERWATDMIIAARAQFLSMPTKLAPQLVGLTDVNAIAMAIKANVYEGLSGLAAKPPAVEGMGEMEPAAELDRQPVGRPRKDAQQRKRSGAGAVED
jgi:hypothetical protein